MTEGLLLSALLIRLREQSLSVNGVVDVVVAERQLTIA